MKALPSRLTLVTKTDNPYQAQQKSTNIEKNTKKPRENRQKHSQKCANNRNKTQQSVKKKAKIAAQQRKKRIKTTTGNTQFTARLVGSAAQNRKRNPPDQQTKATAVRSTSGTTKQTKTSANKNIVRQTNTHQRRLSRGAVRSSGRIHPQTAEITTQTKKHSGRPCQTDCGARQPQQNNRKHKKNAARQGRHTAALPAAQRGSVKRQDTPSNS